jgi:hypothetical protein
MLNQTETARLENYGIWPSCKRHYHISRREALKMLEADTHRLVGGLNTKVPTYTTMIVPCITNDRVWRNVPCGGPQGYVVKQYVKV